ncbi:AAA family ATPase [Pelagibacterium halotolerans]|uniref:Putative serine protease n=1 Tax=Pelagibacterium halotolerans (strain DSM 22347 / JCM 15775 / CGMCC 1.7692 / B2) TaxID=1082931 RepID=G4RC83_PELHB|nr:AAA family ATPase [Pelagibacterium halotolerans]AEQ52706.1 putative serine protease [Pelagibacterium halotolerans B2]QJR17591.1 AAA family ATPase [Pelagibacterium halotolerans]SEA84781.1 ATPase family associated with various cellular activities (AAA) [Pelagibacterium halotolerans]
MTKETTDTGRQLAALEEIDVDSMRALKNRGAEILAGDLPALEEILIHGCWCANSMVTDRIRFFASILHNRILSEAEREIIEQAISDGSAPVLELCREIFGIRGRFSDVARCDLYIACADTERDGYDDDATEAAVQRLFRERQSVLFDARYGEMLRHATTLGLIGPSRSIRRYLNRAQALGMQRLLELGRDVDAYRQADVWLTEHPDALHDIQDDSKKSLFEKLQALEEDRAEIGPDLDFDRPGVVVVPALSKGVGGQKDSRKAFESIAGKPLPLVDRGPIDLHFEVLVAKWPHARDVIDSILFDLASDERIRFRPMCLVGKPGSGKTALLRAIAAQLSLPCEVFSMGGMADGSAMGTSAQWSTSRPSVPLQLIQRSGFANGVIVWDEIEKASDSRHNGSAFDALLPMLERSQAAAIRDPALEVTVDLSWISHFATANDVDTIPDPLRDRMRIIRMPEPTWQHIGPLSKQIIRDIARDRGVDERWYPPLADDEMGVIREAWPGGSLRKLRRAIEGTLSARDSLMGRA